MSVAQVFSKSDVFLLFVEDRPTSLPYPSITIPRLTTVSSEALPHSDYDALEIGHFIVHKSLQAFHSVLGTPFVNFLTHFRRKNSSEDHALIRSVTVRYFGRTVVPALAHTTGFSKGNIHFAKLRQVEDFLTNLISRMGSLEQDKSVSGQEAECDDSMCCICYTSLGDSQFLPCLHRSCYGCITRHLLNCQRCFFCNATVVGVIKDEKRTSTVD
ncbi:hypothetical protein KSS87_006590 [Heliosperma pusillum]|nr:hypothetical protein KSS87_006590 [Heliosperma pusillum]